MRPQGAVAGVAYTLPIAAAVGAEERLRPLREDPRIWPGARLPTAAARARHLAAEPRASGGTADAPALGAGVARRASSNLASPTNLAHSRADQEHSLVTVS